MALIRVDIGGNRFSSLSILTVHIGYMQDITFSDTLCTFLQQLN